MNAARRSVVSCALLGFLFLVRPAAAQEDGQYRRLVDAYAHGDSIAPIVELAGWRLPRLRSAFESTRFAEDRIKAAVMLHTETALALHDEPRAYAHIDRARTLLGSVPKPDRDRLGFTAFSDRWVAVEAILYASYGNLRRAQIEIDQALRSNDDNVDALLVKGALIDLDLEANEPNPRGAWNGTRNYVEGRAKASSDAFGALVQRHPESLEARLRFGWALLINHSPAIRVREQLSIVAATAKRADLKYLAYLFLGAAESRGGDLPEAGSEYENAHAILPRESSYMALIQNARARGLTEQSDRLALEFAHAPATVLDPWQSFYAGLTDNEIIEWLQKEARAR